MDIDARVLRIRDGDALAIVAPAAVLTMPVSDRLAWHDALKSDIASAGITCPVLIFPPGTELAIVRDDRPGSP